MTEKTKIKNRERARKWYQDNRQRKLDYERERLNKGKVLQDRIDKAVEYIEKYYDEWMHSGEFISVIENNNRILNILKGSDNNE